jgi:lipopolysaccharide core galacturonosyltransferase RgtB
MRIGLPALVRRPGANLWVFARLRSPGAMVLILSFALIVISSALRLALTDNLQPDEAELSLFAQSLRGGYSEQPPLYTWMLWAVFQITGTGLAGLTIVRAFLLIALSCLTYLVAHLVTPDRRLLVPLAFSSLMMPAYSWHAFTFLTHSVLLGVAVMATVYATIRVIFKGGAFDYALLGAAVGVGALAKYNFPLVVFAAVAAGATIPAVRPRLLNPRLLLTAAVAGLIVLPHLMWLADWWEDVFLLVRNKANRAELPPYWDGVWEGLCAGAYSLAGCVALVVPLLVWLCRGAHRIEPADVAVVWLGRFFVLHMVLVFGFGATRFQDRWLLPLLLPLPVWYLARFAPNALGSGRIRLLNWTTAVLAIAILGGQVAQIVHADRLPGRFDVNLDYSRLAQELEAGGHGQATYISWDREILGNLLLFMPDAKLWYPTGVESIDALSGPVVVLWEERLGDQPPWGLTPPLAEKYGQAPINFNRLRTFTLHSRNPAGRSATIFIYCVPRKVIVGEQ